MLRKIFTSTLAALVLVATSVAPAAADVNSNMSAYWSNGMAAASVTGPSAYVGQKGGYFTGGNLSMRAPQDTYQLSSYAMPSLKGGCGGIDLFTGAFSFIGADQLIAMIKGIASNAAPYAFMLALSLLSSPISDQLKTFQTWAQKMNFDNISSCEAAQTLVDGAAKMAMKDSFCQRLGRERGVFSDGVAARNGCGANALTAVQASNAKEKEWDPVNKNLAWEAIKKHPLLSGDYQLAQLMQSITGTMIITCPETAEGEQNCVRTVLAPKAGKESVLTALLDGGPVTAHRCDEADRCLKPTENGLTITVNSNAALKTKVSQQLTKLIDKIRARAPLDADQIDFVNMTSLPVYKMAAVFASMTGVASEVAMQQYAEVIAIDIAYSWLMNGISKVEEGKNRLQGIPGDDLNAWTEQTQAVRQELLLRQQNVTVKAAAIDEMMARVAAIERTMQGEQASRIAETLSYTHAMAR